MYEPLAELQVQGDAILLPGHAWSEQLLPLLMDVAASSSYGDELPMVETDGELQLSERCCRQQRRRASPRVAVAGHAARLALCPRTLTHRWFDSRRRASAAVLLEEMMQEMLPAHLHQTLEALHAYGESPLPVAGVGRVLVALAHLDGPLKLTAQPTPCDPQTFSQHLLALSSQLNMLHDQKLCEYLHSPHFKRSKFELFALQHMQLLTWLQRVHTALMHSVAKHGPELQQYMVQLGHAARVLVFQPTLLHTLHVVQTCMSLPSEPVPGSMRQAMTYPADSATDFDRVEWLQLNLLLQFQSIYKMALCQPDIYQHPQAFSPGEASLVQGFLRLEEIYTHLIGRFPQCCRLSAQEQAVLANLCQQLNKYFADGHRIRKLIEQQSMMPQSMGKHAVAQLVTPSSSSPQFAVRDWILPFMVTFCELLKIIWQLWTNLVRKQQAMDAQRRSIEGLARLAGSAIVKQLTDQAHRLAHTAPSMPVGPDRSRFFDLEDDPLSPPPMPSQAFQKPAPGPPAIQQQQLSSSLPGMATMAASQPQPLFDASHLPQPPQQQHIATSTATMIDQPSSQQPLPAASQAVTAPGTAPAPLTTLLPAIPRVGLLEPADTSLSAAINGLLEGTDAAAMGSGWASVVRRPASEAPPPAAVGPPSTAPPASPKPARLTVPASAPTGTPCVSRAAARSSLR